MREWKPIRWPGATQRVVVEITPEMFESFLPNVFENTPECMHDDALRLAYSVFFYGMCLLEDEMLDRGLTTESYDGQVQALLEFPPGVSLPRGLVRDDPADDVRPDTKERLN